VGRRVGFHHGLLALALAVAGCAAQREARVRRAWNKQDPRRGGPAGPTRDVETEEQDEPTAAPPKQGWARVEELLERTTAVLTTAPSPSVLAELAVKWCEVEPAPRQTPYGEVRVCYLYPAVRVDGIALTLELSEQGIVGFVAPELDRAKSQALVEEARGKLEHLCQQPWQRVDAQLEVETCTVNGGSTLAVGRLQPRPEDERWQVSVSVLGAI
jgi:hypothetical protein